MNISILTGLITSSLLTFVLVFHGAYAIAKEHHIAYQLNLEYTLRWLLGALYLMATIAPCLVSSVRRVWYLGVINLCSYAITKLVFAEFVISIWCYFAAMSSVLVVIILNDVHVERSRTSATPTDLVVVQGGEP